MTPTEIHALSNADVNTLLHKYLGAPWDETRCRVCGWKLGELRVMPPRDPNWPVACWSDSCCQRPIPKIRADAAPAYSTSWEGMRLVLDKLKEEYWEWTLDGGSKATGCHCRLWRTMFPGQDIAIQADTASGAVARAALLLALTTKGEAR